VGHVAGPVAEEGHGQAGFLVNAVQPDAIRLAPPLIISPAEVTLFTEALPAILESAAASGSAA
jgi:acetylornithine/succinyldiaminopimelate/putrescine aminotransferase